MFYVKLLKCTGNKVHCLHRYDSKQVHNAFQPYSGFQTTMKLPKFWHIKMALFGNAHLLSQPVVLVREYNEKHNRVLKLSFQSGLKSSQYKLSAVNFYKVRKR